MIVAFMVPVPRGEGWKVPQVQGLSLHQSSVEPLLAHPAVPAEVKGALRTGLAPLDPLEILHQVREGQAALAALSSGDPGHGPERESPEAFLAKLPGLWREGEARPTHRSETPSPRAWRTRKDPFEAAWPEILLWLQEDPE